MDVKRTKLYVLAIGLWVFSASGCGDPCVDLSHKVCRCERTELDQRACIQRVNDESNAVTVSQAQQDACILLMDACNCEKLAAGDLAACGLALESEPQVMGSGWQTGGTDNNARLTDEDDGRPEPWQEP